MVHSQIFSNPKDEHAPGHVRVSQPVSSQHNENFKASKGFSNYSQSNFDYNHSQSNGSHSQSIGGHSKLDLNYSSNLNNKANLY
jgi:hypothetical protein